MEASGRPWGDLAAPEGLVAQGAHHPTTLGVPQ